MKRSYVSNVRITGLAGNRSMRQLTAGALTFACRIGRKGATRAKREGDGCSPVGNFRILRGWWRPDRRFPPRCGLPMRAQRRNDGWCDTAGHRCYNRLVKLPLAASHEEMWRDDHQYDVVLEISWNTRPRISGRGSAIFLHLMSDSGQGTAGCVAVPPAKIDRLMALLGRKTRISIR